MKEIIEKIKCGDPLSDSELNKAIEHYTTLRELLEPHGDIFHLTWKEVHLELIRLEEYQKSRK